MKTRALRKRRRWKATALLPAALGAAIGVCQGQSATVIFQVEMPDKEMKKGLRIRAIQKSPRTRSRSQELVKSDYNFTTHVYTHKIDRLPPGTYDFVLCDHRQYTPQKQSGKLEGGQVLTINFLPEDQPKGDMVITDALLDPEGPALRDTPVFLKDIATGCTITSVNTDDTGHYTFKDLPKMKYEVSRVEADRDP
jgi:hypothetical protein